MSALQKTVKCLLLVAIAAGAQESWEAGLSDSDPRKRIRAARELAAAENGFRHVALLAPLLQDNSEEVRTAAVVALIKVRSIDGQPLLIAATEDLSPRVQSLAVDGLVDFYMPGYVKLGRVASITSFGASLRDRFSKPNPVVLAAYVEVNPEVIGLSAKCCAMAAASNAGRTPPVLSASCGDARRWTHCDRESALGTRQLSWRACSPPRS